MRVTMRCAGRATNSRDQRQKKKIRTAYRTNFLFSKMVVAKLIENLFSKGKMKQDGSKVHRCFLVIWLFAFFGNLVIADFIYTLWAFQRLPVAGGWSCIQPL